VEAASMAVFLCSDFQAGNMAELYINFGICIDRFGYLWYAVQNNRIGYFGEENRKAMEKFLALSEEKQTAIRNAALACFAKHGYEKASVHDIAAAAGISKASIFQYFGTKQNLYAYLFQYCSSQMKQAYDLSALDANMDFFDRVWAASVMKVENLKRSPYIAAFITSAATERAPGLKDILAPAMEEGKRYTEALVLHEEDCAKFRRPKDAKLVFRMLLLLGEGMVSRLENGTDYDGMMAELEGILRMLRYNFYKEEYLP